MNKAELETALSGKFTAVLGISGPTITGNIKYYVANVLDVIGNTARQVNIGYFVMHEGDPGEAAYWSGVEPKPTVVPPEPTFTEDVLVWLQSKVADETILHFSGLAANIITERATVTIVIDDAGNLVEKRYAVWRNAVDEWQFQAISSMV